MRARRGEVTGSDSNTGDLLMKLKPNREHDTQEVIADLRKKLMASQPGIEWEFPGILGDLIGDLTWSPEPIEIKIFSTDIDFLKETAPKIEEAIKPEYEHGVLKKGVSGIVDSKDGLIVAGPSPSHHVRLADAQRFGITANDIAVAVNTAKFGQTASSVLHGDRVINIRVLVDPRQIDRMATLRSLPLRAADGSTILLHHVADIREEPGQLELHREDQRQYVAVTARLENRDLGSAMAEIQKKLGKEFSLPPPAPSNTAARISSSRNRSATSWSSWSWPSSWSSLSCCSSSARSSNRSRSWPAPCRP